MDRDGQDYSLPECSTPFLIEWLLEIGPVLGGGLGAAAISWRDLVAWQECSGVVLAPWQARMLVELSREYAAFSHKAEKADCPPPWAEPMTEGRRTAVARALRTGFKALLLNRRK